MDKIIVSDATVLIKRNAFEYSKARELVLPATLQTIEEGAFANNCLDDITCQALTPPTLGSRTLLRSQYAPEAVVRDKMHYR